MRLRRFIEMGCRTLLLALAFAPLATFASALANQHALSPGQEDEVREIVREYILENPDIILEALQSLESQQQTTEDEQVHQVIVARQGELFADPDSPVGGNPAGDITIVEFFDYRCPYCKKVHPELQDLLKSDGNIRFVYKEWPILGPPSIFAARAALASRGQDKYVEFHDALMEARGDLNEDVVFTIAGSVGLDTDRLERDMAAGTAETNAALGRISDLAEALQITGTPGFVIGDIVIRGALELDDLKSIVAEVRQRATAAQ